MTEKLADLIAQATQIEKSIIECNGELSPETEQSLLEIDLSQSAAVDAVQITLDRLEASSLYWKNRAEIYSKVSKALEISEMKLRRFVKGIMAASGSPDLYGIEWRFKLSELKPKTVINQDLLEREYLKEKVTLVPDKERIEEDLHLGIPVQGASLEPVYSLRTYPNKKELSR